MLSDHQKDLIRKTFTIVASDADAAAAMFYQRLFEIEPSVRSLFKSDMTEQGQKLMQILGVAVGSLNRQETLQPALEMLGQRHLSYGVQREHYAMVGEAFLWMLQETLGDDFTSEAKDAWIMLYTELAGIAIAKAYPTETAGAQ